MSITSARKFFEKSGCGTVFIVLAGLAMVASMVFMRGGGGGPTGGSTEDTSATLAKVGDFKVQEAPVMDSFDALRNRDSEGKETGLDADAIVKIYGDMLVAHVGSNLVLDLAKTQGISFTDSQLLELGKADADKQADQMKKTLENMGAIKPGATAAEVNTAFKSMMGQTLDEYKAVMLQQLAGALSTYAGRLEASARYSSEKLRERYMNDIKVSDEELRGTFLTYVTKRVVFGGLNVRPKDEAMAEAEQVLADIKAGKITFEAAMNKYSKDPAPAKDKPKSDSLTNLTKSILDYDPTLSEIPKLKPGQTTGIVMTSAGPGIYKLISVKSDIPANFDAQKEELRKTEIRQRADRKVRDEIIKIRDDGRVKWESKGAEAMFLWNLSEVDNKYQTDKKKRKELLEKALGLVQEAMGGDTGSATWATVANYAVRKSLRQLSTPEENKASATDFLTAKIALCDIVDTVDMRLELAKEFLALKDKGQASEQLAKAAEINSTFGPVGQGYISRILGVKGQLKSAGMLTPEGEKKLDEEVTRWKTDASQDLAYQTESLLDYTTAEITRYEGMQKQVKLYETNSWMMPDSKKQIEESFAKWKKGAFEAIKVQAESLTDYTATGQAAWKEVGELIKSFVKLGALDATQSAELQKLTDKWKPGVYEALKKEAQDNKDYTSAGQTLWSEANGRIQELEKLGVLTSTQADELRKIQEAWKTAKKAADAKAASEANKPSTQGTTGSNLVPGTGPSGGGTTGLSGLTTGTTGGQ